MEKNKYQEALDFLSAHAMEYQEDYMQSGYNHCCPSCGQKIDWSDDGC